MPSLWGCTEQLCAHRTCSPPLWVASQTPGWGPGPLYQEEGSRGWGGCLELSRLIGCHSKGSVLCRRVGDPWYLALEQIPALPSIPRHRGGRSSREAVTGSQVELARLGAVRGETGHGSRL